MEYEQILAILDKWIANMEDEFEVLWLLALIANL